MKNILIKAFDNLRLQYRFACRKIGLPNYEIHQIYLPRQALLYIPIPKNACTSIKHALYEIEFGQRFSPSFRDRNGYEDHHDYYKKRTNAFTGLRSLESMEHATRFTLVRDPIKRLISCYRNRVIDLDDLKASETKLEKMGLPRKPDINTFILNLDRYRKASKNIEHHSRPQHFFLGGTIDYLDRIFPMEDMESLKKMLKTYKPDLKMLKRKSGGTNITLADLKEEALQHAISFYSRDYKLLENFYSPQNIRNEYQELIS